jgi:hypothetical protein
MNAIVLLAALAILPRAELPERVDLLETNHFHDSEGREVFVQHIAYDWHTRHGCHHVAAWALCKSEARHDFTRGEWVVSFKDREFRAPVYRESWTQRDPELVDREAWPVNQRRFK